MTGKIRIISGQWRGRKLPVADWPGLRPTGDRARETLFNWLGPRIIGTSCLDLFAGTGALGLEAVSRGAARLVLVEQHRPLADSLRAIAEGLPGGEVISVVHADAEAWLEGQTDCFDVVFVDPPFGQQMQGPILEQLATTGVLKPGGLVYVEDSVEKDDSSVDEPARWYETVREKKQGRVLLRLLKLKSRV